jgi:hypothetical protein
VRLHSVDERWELALIASNLLDELVPISTADNPGTGSGTGTAAVDGLAIKSDTYIQSTTTPREIAVQLTVRF